MSEEEDAEVDGAASDGVEVDDVVAVDEVGEVDLGTPVATGVATSRITEDGDPAVEVAAEGSLDVDGGVHESASRER